MDPHGRYERRMALWLVLTYAAIALVSAALVVYSAWALGWRPRR